MYYGKKYEKESTSHYGYKLFSDKIMGVLKDSDKLFLQLNDSEEIFM